MDTEALESLLEGAEETDSLEFKGAMSWDRNSLVRDILAMANIIDGGRIVIGVEDGTMVRQGLNEEQVRSFNLETMRDAVAPFADPRVEFRCEIVADRAGLQFAVISVSPFEDIPVICRRDGHDVDAGTVYYRSRSGRPRSARVDNSSDMRDIIERSVSRSAMRLRRHGLVPVEPAIVEFDDELGDL